MPGSIVGSVDSTGVWRGLDAVFVVKMMGTVQV